MDTHAYSLGDVSATLRWQPWAAVRGRPVTTLYHHRPADRRQSLQDQPDKDISTGNGYYSPGFGANMSYVIDPVVLYGSLGYTWNLPVDDVHQTLADNSQLEKVSPGNTINFNMGMAYALSYDVSLATSYQMAYTLKNRYHTTAGTFESSEQTSSIMNFARLADVTGLHRQRQRRFRPHGRLAGCTAGVIRTPRYQRAEGPVTRERGLL